MIRGYYLGEDDGAISTGFSGATAAPNPQTGDICIVCNRRNALPNPKHLKLLQNRS